MVVQSLILLLVTLAPVSLVITNNDNFKNAAISAKNLHPSLEVVSYLC